MTAEYKADIIAANKAMADKALRVLACAERVWVICPTRIMWLLLKVTCVS